MAYNNKFLEKDNLVSIFPKITETPKFIQYHNNKSRQASYKNDLDDQ
jgi:hypothetical protein